jgi:MraZ protein
VQWQVVARHLRVPSTLPGDRPTAGAAPGAEGPMLRGNCPAKIDAKGRLKIPTSFRRYIEDQYGKDFFVTSLSGEFARLYPMPVWVEIEKKVQAVPSMNPAIQRFMNHVSYYGQMSSMDEQGRMLIHPLLRQSSGLTGVVAVLGKNTYLDVWSQETFLSQLKQQPLSDEDKNVLAALGL